MQFTENVGILGRWRKNRSVNEWQEGSESYERWKRQVTAPLELKLSTGFASSGKLPTFRERGWGWPVLEVLFWQTGQCWAKKLESSKSQRWARITPTACCCPLDALELESLRRTAALSSFQCICKSNNKTPKSTQARRISDSSGGVTSFLISRQSCGRYCLRRKGNSSGRTKANTRAPYREIPECNANT